MIHVRRPLIKSQCETSALLLGILLGVLILPRAARAAEPLSGEQAAQANSLIEDGIVLRRSRRDELALDRFERAYALVPSPRAAAQLALCLQALGRWAEALPRFDEALKAGHDPWIAKHRDTLELQHRAARGHVGHLEVAGHPEGSQVWVNGRRVGHLPLPAPLVVNTGNVDLELRAEGHRTVTRNISLGAEQHQRLFIRLEPAALNANTLVAFPAKPEDDVDVSSNRRYWLWGGVGAVIVGAIAVGLAVGLSGGGDGRPSPSDRQITF